MKLAFYLKIKWISMLWYVSYVPNTFPSLKLLKIAKTKRICKHTITNKAAILIFILCNDINQNQKTTTGLNEVLCSMKDENSFLPNETDIEWELSDVEHNPKPRL